MVSVGALTPAEALAAVGAQWNVLLFFLGLMATAAVAEQSGVLAWLTGGTYRLARGRRDVLLVLISALCVAVTATLSNDATILLLTPLVIRMVDAVGAPALPYAFACALLANAASSLLPVANPTNVIVLERAPMLLSDYLRTLLLPSVAAVTATIVALLVTFRDALREPLVERRRSARERPADALGFAIALAAIVSSYLVALQVGVAIGPVAVIGGGILAAALLGRRRLNPRAFAAEIEWGIFPFFAGLVVVVTGAERAGLVGAAANVIASLASAGGPPLVAIAAALAANAMNNLPAAVLAGAGLADAGPSLAAPHATTAAVLIGVDIGPSFTTLGSLATIMWLLILRRRGHPMTSLGYVRIAALPSLAAFAAALAALAVSR